MFLLRVWMRRQFLRRPNMISTLRLRFAGIPAVARLVASACRNRNQSASKPPAAEKVTCAWHGVDHEGDALAIALLSKLTAVLCAKAVMPRPGIAKFLTVPAFDVQK